MRIGPTSTLACATALAVVLGACASEDDPGSLNGGRGGDEDPGVTEVVPEAAALLDEAAFGETPIRRQTRAELRASLVDVFGVDPGALMENVPTDLVGTEVRNPFDNDAELQDVSTDLVVRMSSFAKDYAALVTAKPTQLYALAGCNPAGPSDAACFEKIVRALGRLAFRRAVTNDEVTRLGEMMTYAKEENDFASAVDGFVRIVVQHPEFLYRVETGTPTAVPGVYALSDHEIATRLSFLLWGRIPDAALLDAADAGKLQTPGGRRTQAERMLADPRAKEHWARFHAQWLGYANVTPPAALADAMKAESAALVSRVVFEDGHAWLDLFREDESFVTPDLAKHYGMAVPPAPAWVKYDGLRGGGVLAHGGFLMQGAKFGETSPTLRGYRILKRALCKELGAIPPGIDTDNPPASTSPTACKPERYSMRSNPSCASCHAQTDGLGFGLENFGATGEWRTTEPNVATCAIDGRGDVAGKAFSGPRELGAILADAPETASCADRQLLRFALGRPDDAGDAATLKALDAQLASKKELRSLLRSLAETPAIARRVERSSR